MRVRGLTIFCAILLGAPATAHGAVALSLDTTSNSQVLRNQPLAVGTDANENLTASSAFADSGAHVLAFAGQRGGFTATQPCRVLSTASGECPFAGGGTLARGQVRLAGGDDVFTEGTVATGTPSATIDIDLGAGNDRNVPGPLEVNLSGGAGDDTIDHGNQRFGNVFGGDGEDLITVATGGPIFPGRGSDILLQTTRPSTLTQSEPQVVTIDGLCNDGGAADASVANGQARILGGLRCEGNGVDRDNLGSAPVVLTGGNQGDSLTGSPGDDFLGGFNGGDTLTGGDGVDSLSGDAGDDLLLARDGIRDGLIRCGDGNDRAVVDPVDPVEPDCETIERGGQDTPGPVGGGNPLPPDTPGVPPDATAPTAPPQENVPSNGSEGPGPGGGDNGATPPEVKMADQVGTIRKGKVELRVVCVYLAQECTGTVDLTAAKQVKKGDTKLRKGAAIGDAEVSIPWGVDEAVEIPLAGKAKSLLKGGKKIAANAEVEASDSAAGGGGAVGRATAKVQLGGR